MSRGIAVLMACVALAWVLELIDLLTSFIGVSTNSFGIRPRTLSGLAGIFFSPLLHGNIPHLLANTVPFFILGILVILRGIATFIGVSLMVIVLGGLGVWLLAPANTVHIGASGLIFGYFGYLLARGYFERSVSAIMIAVIVGLVYGSLLWGVLPGQRGISWQGHLFGFLAGIVTAGVMRARPRSTVTA